MFASIKAEYPKNSYTIYLSDNLTDNLEQYLSNFKKESVVFVCDNYFENKSFLPDDKLYKLIKNYKSLFLDGGVGSKNLSELTKIWSFFNENKLPRDGCIIALGGGVIGDLCGLAASMYHRGVSLIHVPTTLTSAVDSAIGGKTGVNMYETVNLLGTYYHPIATFIDLRFMKTLDKRDFASGVAESIKKSFIYDKDFYNFILNNSNNIFQREINSLYELIHKSISIKLFHTISDEKEKSLRLLLNYGHTFGQVFESIYGIDEKNLRHGEAVSLGMMCAAQMSENLYGNKEIIKEHYEILSKFLLPTKISCLNNLELPEKSVLIENLVKDKKRTSYGNRFIICSEIGKAKVEHITDKNLIKNSFNLVLE